METGMCLVKPCKDSQARHEEGEMAGASLTSCQDLLANYSENEHGPGRKKPLASDQCHQIGS